MLSDDRVDTKRRLQRMQEDEKQAEMAYRLESVCISSNNVVTTQLIIVAGASIAQTA